MNNIENLPNIFVRMCQIVGLGDEEIWFKWGQIVERSEAQLTQWLDKQDWLSNEQREKFGQMISTGGDYKVVEKWCEANLSSEQLDEVVKKYKFIEDENQKSYYKLMIEQMTLEQRELARLCLDKGAMNG